MGSRHNRKRTRSRPRNRNRSLHGQPLSFDAVATPPPLPQLLPTHSSFSRTSGSHWHQSYAAWNDSVWLPHQRASVKSPFSDAPLTCSPAPRHVKPVDDKCIRVFGGEPEDGMALCGSMMQVVLDLFDGSVDYEDDDVVGMS